MENKGKPKGEEIAVKGRLKVILNDVRESEGKENKRIRRSVMKEGKMMKREKENIRSRKQRRKRKVKKKRK